MGTFGGEPFRCQPPGTSDVPQPGRPVVACPRPHRAGEAPSCLVDTGGQTFTTPAFVPSAESVNAHWPFFDQYEQS